MTQQPPKKTPYPKPHQKPRAADARFSSRSIMLFIAAVVVMALVFAIVVNYLMAQYRPSPAHTRSDTAIARDLSVEPIDAETLQTLSESELDEADLDAVDEDAPATPEVTARTDETVADTETATDSASASTAAPAAAQTATQPRPAPAQPPADMPTPPIIREPAPPLPGHDPVMQSDPEDEKVAAIIDQVRRINEAKLAPVLSPQPAPAADADTPITPSETAQPE